MRRYAIRSLVAILTFAIGVTLSLALGLFKPRHITVLRASSCSKEFRVGGAPFITVDNPATGPLKLSYWGTTLESDHGQKELRLQFSVENRSGRTVTAYVIGSEKIWKNSEGSGVSFFDLSFNEILEPGESRLFTLPLNTEGLSVSAAAVRFEDGSTWTNPRANQQ